MQLGNYDEWLHAGNSLSPPGWKISNFIFNWITIKKLFWQKCTMGPCAVVSLECVSSPPSLVAFLFQQKEARWENEGFAHKERKAPWFCFKSFFEWPDVTLHIWVRFFRLRLIYVNRLGVGLKTEDWSKVNPFFLAQVHLKLFSIQMHLKWVLFVQQEFLSHMASNSWNPNLGHWDFKPVFLCRFASSGSKINPYIQRSDVTCDISSVSLTVLLLT